MADMQQIYICIGSNEPDAMARVKEASNALESKLSDAHICGPYRTLPYPPAPADGPVYANAVVSGRTELSLEAVKTWLKETESNLGRRAGHKNSGKVVIDLDIVVYGNEICRFGEFEADYFRHGYEILLSKKPDR